MQVRLLGPVDIETDGAVREIAGLRRKAVLAALAVAHGEIVSTDRLIEAVWGGDPPATPLNTLQPPVSPSRPSRPSPAGCIRPGRVATPPARPGPPPGGAAPRSPRPSGSPGAGRGGTGRGRSRARARAWPPPGRAGPPRAGPRPRSCRSR